MDAEFFKNPGPMRGDRLGADEKFHGDLAARATASDQPQHLLFARRQAADALSAPIADLSFFSGTLEVKVISHRMSPRGPMR